MAIGSKNLDAVSLRDRSDDELVEELKKAKESLFNLRFQGATGQLESHGRLKAVRRDIARIYTVMRERELGIVTVVAAPAEKKAEAKAEKAEAKAEPKKTAAKKTAAKAEPEADDAEAPKKAAPRKRTAKKAAPQDTASSAEKRASDEDGAE
ncbi:50S ribosomal protein L29 [Jiangella aurantiaca]|uniref:Large ribosomal subunit protein uL29 n=1 Tax=Jiangella aurantiaca TaxID=2530373 RepID=A0A4R5AKB6_9ACTN|nr:50S ribosomal protein L29 [Jiangella aurantiaca]